MTDPIADMLARIRNSSDTLAYDTLGAGYDTRYFPKVAARTVTDREVGGVQNGNVVRTTSATYTYDAFGNLDLSVESTGAGLSANQFTVTTDPTVVNYTGATWCLGMPSAVSATSQIIGGASATRNTTYTHYSLDNVARCRFETETLPSDGTYTAPNLQLTKTYGYDAYGNASSVMLSGPGVTTRTSTVSFAGTSGYFPSSSTNAAGHVSSMAWNYSYAKPATATDPNDLITYFGYDAYGRPFYIVPADRVATRWTYSWWTNDCQSQLERLCIQQYTDVLNWDSGEASQQSYTVHDVFGRAKHLRRKEFGGTWSISNRTFDALGRVLVDEIPHLPSDPTFNVSRSYDLVGRVLTEVKPASEAAF